jgi:hypothetical protein
LNFSPYFKFDHLNNETSYGPIKLVKDGNREKWHNFSNDNRQISIMPSIGTADIQNFRWEKFALAHFQEQVIIFD